MQYRELIVLFFAITGIGYAAADNPGRDLSKSVLWEISSAPKKSRWIIIRKPSDGQRSDLYHIEVLERVSGSKPWEFARLAPHMAITVDALAASVRRPLKKGDVYPESYNGAYQKWVQYQQTGDAPVCKTTVERCLKGAK